ncbi:hypothetical protein MLD38_018901 [Melastoma candidum]|uniref:Uncharacterized protein n=1 Tax=Melastoma candidum TaxID=119954 RepID=A0ACB9QV73_9MYRT|nr:hypothetical protein MLD38_018901 [Melastoma candidum]
MNTSVTVTVVSETTVHPSLPSSLPDLPLSSSDLPMLSCHYIQKGLLFPLPSSPPHPSIPDLLRHSLSSTLSLFPPLAGRLFTSSPTGRIFLSCNDSGASFIHAFVSPSVPLLPLLTSATRTPSFVTEFFPFDRTVSYCGHSLPILAVQVTEMVDAVFIGCSVNHAVLDGTSLWNFFNAYADVCRCGVESVTKLPDFRRENGLITSAVLKIPEGGPLATFDENEPIAERIFSFSREAILRLKAKVNKTLIKGSTASTDAGSAAEAMGKQMNDFNCWDMDEKSMTRTARGSIPLRGIRGVKETTSEVSSFQALCALLWKAVTRARKLPASKVTTFRMAINCRHRMEPKLDPLYFGNAIQSIPTYASAGDVTSRDLRWCAEQLNKNVRAHDGDAVRKGVEDWEKDPRLFPLGNKDGGAITMGSSPRFPMYDNDFGWGRPVAIRSGRANKFDGKISAFPGRKGGGSVDLEVVLKPETLSRVEGDEEFMQYVTK